MQHPSIIKLLVLAASAAEAVPLVVTTNSVGTSDDRAGSVNTSPGGRTEQPTHPLLKMGPGPAISTKAYPVQLPDAPRSPTSHPLRIIRGPGPTTAKGPYPVGKPIVETDHPSRPFRIIMGPGPTTARGPYPVGHHPLLEKGSGPAISTLPEKPNVATSTIPTDDLNKAASIKPIFDKTGVAEQSGSKPR
ncbi:hypothetical protein PspLS_01651 [Pyricularia sp. CBS 133598]|nr:hypothetical protein PspLS_01651 [Pyricularia sp. CBS 133598]